MRKITNKNLFAAPTLSLFNDANPFNHLSYLRNLVPAGMIDKNVNLRLFSIRILAFLMDGNGD